MLPSSTNNVNELESSVFSNNYNKNRSRVILIDKPTLTTELKSHQEKAIKFALNLEKDNDGGCIFDEMGMGKTLTTIALYVTSLNKGLTSMNYNFRHQHKMLVICPKQAINEWIGECNKHTFDINIAKFDRNKKNLITSNDIIVTNYDRLVSEYKRHFEKNIQSSIYNREWFRVVLDEGHVIRNKETERWKAVEKLKEISTKKWALTGTPIQNRIKDIWTIFSFINVENLGTWSDWCKTNEQVLFEKTKKILSKYSIRRLSGDDLPPLYEFKLSKGFYSDEEKNLYDMVYNNIVNFIDKYDDAKNNEGLYEGISDTKDIKSKIKDNILSQLIKLRQICVLPSLVLTDKNEEWTSINCTKMRMLEEYVETKIDPDDKVLVYSNFLDVLNTVEIKLDSMNLKHVRLDGDTKEKDRVIAINDFNNKKDIKFFLISLKAGSSSLNLQCANRVLFMDLGHNPQTKNQAIGRAHRMGQLRPVTVTYFTITGSIEDKMKDRNYFKELISECVLSDKPLEEAIDGFNGLKKNLLNGNVKHSPAYSSSSSSSSNVIVNKKIKTSMAAIRDVVSRIDIDSHESVDEESEYLSKQQIIDTMRNKISDDSVVLTKRSRSETCLDTYDSRPTKKRKVTNNDVQSEEAGNKVTNSYNLGSIKDSINITKFIVKGTTMYSYDWLVSDYSDENSLTLYLTLTESFMALLSNLRASKKNYDVRSMIMSDKLKTKIKSLQNDSDRIVARLNSKDIYNIDVNEQYELNSALSYNEKVIEKLSNRLRNSEDFYQGLSCAMFEMKIKEDIALTDNMKCVPLTDKSGNYALYDDYSIPNAYIDQSYEATDIDTSVITFWTNNNYFQSFNPITDSYIDEYYNVKSLSTCLSGLEAPNLSSSFVINDIDGNPVDILVQQWSDPDSVYVTVFNNVNNLSVSQISIYLSTTHDLDLINNMFYINL